MAGACSPSFPSTKIRQRSSRWTPISGWIVLRSDDPDAMGAPVDVDGDGDASNDPRSVIVQSVSNEAMRLAAGTTDQQLLYIFQEALANNYLEAVTRMNAAFSSVFRTAALVGARSAEHSADTVAADVLATGYNVSGCRGRE